MRKIISMIAIAIATLTTTQATRFEDFDLPIGDRPAGEFFITFKEFAFGQEGDFVWTPGGTGNIGQILGVLTPTRALLIIPWKVGDQFHTRQFEVTPAQVGRDQFNSQADAFAAWLFHFKRFVDQPVATSEDGSSSLVLLAGGLAAVIWFRRRA